MLTYLRFAARAVIINTCILNLVPLAVQQSLEECLLEFSINYFRKKGTMNFFTKASLIYVKSWH